MGHWPAYAERMPPGTAQPEGWWFHIYPDERSVRLSGCEEPRPVVLVEDYDEGAYLGWYELDRGEDRPVMVMPTFLFNVQFAYGVQAEVDAGRGAVVRLRVEEWA